MAIRDVKSNFALTALFAASGELSSTTLNSEAIDLSQGTTTTAIVTLPGDSSGTMLESVAIQFSADSAFTTPVADVTSLGNTVIDISTGEAPVLPLDVDTANGVTLAINIVNPVGTNRYARVVIGADDGSNAASSGSIQGTAFTGPRRFVSAD